MVGRPFPKGKSANPGGRPALPPALKAMKEKTLAKALRLLHEKIHDSRYIRELKPNELFYMLEVAFDRCGLPKVTEARLGDPSGKPLDLAAWLAQPDDTNPIPSEGTK